METVKGNLLDMYDNGSFDAIIHGCNCHNSMGGGIAAQIAARYPDVEKADSETIAGLSAKLGRVMYVDQSDWKAQWLPMFFRRKIVVNAYTQFQGGADGSLEAIFQAFSNISLDRRLNGLQIGIPAIGCGIAGLAWEDVEPIIERTCPQLDITLVEYAP